MKAKYTLSLYLSDMGTFSQPGVESHEDALWHINRARDHDGLPPISLERLQSLPRARKGLTEYAAFTLEN